MNYLTKIILSIPSLLGIVYFFTFLSTDFLKWFTNSVMEFHYQAPIINGLILIQVAFLIYRLWEYDNVDKEKKNTWTALLIIFNFISSLIYIWKKDKEFNQLNNTVHNIG